MQTERLQKYGNLDFHLVSWENRQAGLIIMAHGYGANEKDLVGLVQYLDPQSKYCWAFPAAPIYLGSYMG
ncbi:MAG: hypothetical protein OXT67_09050, partial [Zetaproteobacteria bacterium]|nr:hypothetical protein [Zetaproteobacteria bacterium]